MFSVELGYTLEAAYREATKRQHEYFCVEHILYALLFDETISEIIAHCGGSISELKRKLEDFFDNELDRRVTSPSEEGGELPPHEPEQTPAVTRLMQRAVMQVRAAGKELVTARDVLVAMFAEEETHAYFFLNEQNITRLDVVNFLSHGISKLISEGPEAEPISSGAEDDEEDGSEKVEPKGLLAKVTEELTSQAMKGELDPIIGRDAEIDRMLKILSRRQKNNPLLLGDPGVGKTAMASALAQRIVSGEVPASLKGAKVFVLNIGSLVAGTKFRGEFEERLRVLVKELTQMKNAILFIDEIHTIVGAGATGSGSMDAANLLKPALASGKLRCVGSTTHEEYKKGFEKDRALNRRFSAIDISEPSIAETIQILKGLKGHFEKHHSVSYSAGALKAAAELAAKHITDRFLPDKAIDVIDEAGAANNMVPLSKRKKLIGEKDVEAVVSAMARVPVKSVSRDDEDVLRNLDARLKELIFGQDKAIDAISQAIRRSRASLKGDNKPVGSFLFAGPTGVGKTELARTLAKEMGVHFHKFDMSEYMEKHAVARLIGAPPGYVGYDEGGQLTDLVRKHPYAVVLFDELEKAHEDVFNILLQVMDDAVLTDNQGKKADFRNVILIMTTNAGSAASGSIGFGATRSSDKREEAVKKMFRPEFRNRLDDIVYFNALDPRTIRQIVEKFVTELGAQLSDRSIEIEVTDPVYAWLAEKGFDPQLGARPMNRLIQRELKDPLANEILFGKLKKGGKVRFAMEGDRPVFSVIDG